VSTSGDGLLTLNGGTIDATNIGIAAGAGDALVTNMTVNATTGICIGGGNWVDTAPDLDMTFSGGSINASGSAIMLGTAGAYNPENAEVKFTNGAQVHSDTGVLFTAGTLTEHPTDISLEIDGSGTMASGAFMENEAGIMTSLTVSDGATWTNASGTVDSLTLNNANLELELNNLTVSPLIVNTLTLTGESNVTVTLGNDLLTQIINEEITDNTIDLSDIHLLINSSVIDTTNATGDGLALIVTGKNASGATYTVTPQEGGKYRIDSVAVPEPATWAVFAGLLAMLARTIARRRRS
jgi:hypothetical protein